MNPVYVPLAMLICAGPACAAMSLTSSDLSDGAPMPTQHIYPRCGGKNISPHLAWKGEPGATQSFVLTMIDLDVHPAQWSHWVVVNLPVAVHSVEQGAHSMPANAKTVVSNFGDAAYAGPCPPAGTGLHHYQFTIWALPVASLDLPADEKATDLTTRLSGLALEHASLTTQVQAPAAP